MSTRVVLIRHAAVDSGWRLYGSFDVPLTATARAHVRAVLGKPPTRTAPDALYSSTLARARELAIALGRAWALQPRRAEWAREIHCGHLEGMPLQQVHQDYPELWARNEAQDDETFAWPGGESYREFRTRILAGLETVAATHEGQRIVIVTHAGVISQLLGVVRQRPASAWAIDRPEPFTATELHWEGGQPRAVVTYNEHDWY